MKDDTETLQKLPKNFARGGKYEFRNIGPRLARG